MSLGFQRSGLVLLLLLAMAGSALAHGPQDVSSLSRRIAKEKDRVDTAVFAELAEIGNAKALAALEKAASLLKKLEGLRAVYTAIEAFAGSEPEVCDDARHFLTVQVFRAKNRNAKPLAMRSLLAFGDPALPGIERVLTKHVDPLCRRYACDALVPRLAAQGQIEGLKLLLDNASLKAFEGRRYLGIDAALARGYRELSHHQVVQAALARFSDPESTALLAKKLHGPDTPRGWKLLLVDVFSKRGGQGSLAILAGCLSDQDSAVVLEVIERLKADPSAEGFADQLRALFKSREASVRRAAVVAFGLLEIRDPGVQKDLLILARHSDSALRMGAAAALVELRTPEAIDALHGMLADEQWPVRAEAVAAAARLRDPRSIPFLIERLDHERGRMREDVYGALSILSGMDLGRGSTRWRRWWEDEGEQFELPALEDLKHREEARRDREREAGSTSGPTFYGIEVFSERVCFVLDVSGSMRINAGKEAKLEGPQDPNKPSRMDVAKEQLSDIVRAYPDGKYFNLIFFESEVRWLDERLVKMKKSVRQRSLRFIREQYSLGGTALYSALRLAFDDPLVDTIYLISDGAPTEGAITDIGEIRQEVRRWNSARHVRIHGITIGQDSTLLGWLTEDTGGTYTRRD